MSASTAPAPASLEVTYHPCGCLTVSGWHGTFEDGPRDGETMEQGLHIGTEAAARGRLDFLREDEPGEYLGRRGRVFCVEVRLRKPLGSPARPLSDQAAQELPLHRLGARGYDGVFYRNVVEDPGSVSLLSLGNEHCVGGRLGLPAAAKDAVDDLGRSLVRVEAAFSQLLQQGALRDQL
jgi:hypothetical protein